MINREKKFRTWDKKRKEWYGTSDPSSLTLYGFHIFGECMNFSMPPVSELENLITTQFIGLSDEKGREIYEGDIVKLTGSLGEVVDQVVFKNGCFVVGEEGWYFWDNAEGGSDVAVKVIGNIFENPELLIKSN